MDAGSNPSPPRGVEPIGSALIDFAEAAYDLELEQDEWLPALLKAGAPVLDYGLGVFALTCMRPWQRGPLVVDQLHAISGLDDLADRFIRVERETPADLLWTLSRPTVPQTLSEAAGENLAAFQFVMRHFDFAKDGLGMSTFDPSGRGVYLIAPLPKVTTLSERSRERFQMLAAHFGAGYRLRLALAEAGSEPATDLPHGAEVLIDPNGFRIVEAAGQAKVEGRTGQPCEMARFWSIEPGAGCGRAIPARLWSSGRPWCVVAGRPSIGLIPMVDDSCSGSRIRRT